MVEESHANPYKCRTRGHLSADSARLLPPPPGAAMDRYECPRGVELVPHRYPPTVADNAVRVWEPSGDAEGVGRGLGLMRQSCLVARSLGWNVASELSGGADGE